MASPGRVKQGHEKAEGKTEKGGRLGGAYKDIPANGGEFHHMPANSVNPLSKGRGPAIRMDTSDHRRTASWGNSKDAQKYRAKQKLLISQNQFRKAQQMDIENVRSNFGKKYDEHIKEMQKYTDSLLN